MIKLDRHQAATQLASAIPSRALRRLLLASLAANLLVAGFVAGDVIVDAFDKRPHEIEMSLGPIARALGEEDRKAVLADLRNNPVMAGFHHGTADINISGVVQALRANPFDAASFRGLLADQATKIAEAQNALREALVARLASMSPADRAELADRLAEHN